MSRIAAFVGHSFSKSDEALVNRFLNFFNHVQQLGIGFTWDHAENAEPKVLSEKVKTKMEGKNLFIGICTLKELAVAPEKLQSSFWRPGVRFAQEKDMEPKTSDWITQEIGYSIAKGMKLILLLEDGVRLPGGLQGDIEHIAFDRRNPSEAFEKIMEMLRALEPQVQPLEHSTSLGKAEPSKAEDKESKDPIEGEPDDTWTRENYKQAVFGAMASNDDDRSAALLASFGKSKHGQDPEQHATLEAYSLGLARFFSRKGAHNSRLEELVEKFPRNVSIRTELASSYESFGVYDKAAQQYAAAADCVESAEDRVGWLTNAAASRARGGDVAADTWLRTQYASLPTKTTQAARIFRRGLLDVAKIRKATPLWIAYQEARLLDLPDKYDSRSDLAWEYFQRTQYGLALYHYLLLPYSERSHGVWNNIGAAYAELEMPAKAVAAYRTSEELGGTYAVSNLAYIFIDAGFHKEAEELCRTALSKPDSEKRVAAALASITTKATTETQKSQEVSKAAEAEHQFMARLGNAFCASAVLAPATSWVTPECVLAVTIEGGRFKAVGTYQQPSGALTLFSGQGSSTTMVVTYEGELVGLGVTFRKRKHEQGSKPSALESGDEGYIIFDEKLQTASEIVKADKKAPSYQEWKRSS